VQTMGIGEMSWKNVLCTVVSFGVRQRARFVSSDAQY
jgi:hypothetical protein